eukprot:SAG31_NODE_2970_length_4839_cov_2.684810_1_plen_281_part_00
MPGTVVGCYDWIAPCGRLVEFALDTDSARGRPTLSSIREKQQRWRYGGDDASTDESDDEREVAYPLVLDRASLNPPAQSGTITLSGDKDMPTALINIDHTPLNNRAETCKRVVDLTTIGTGTRILFKREQHEHRTHAFGTEPTQTQDFVAGTVISYIKEMGKHVVMPANGVHSNGNSGLEADVQLVDLREKQFVFEPSRRPIDQLIHGGIAPSGTNLHSAPLRFKLALFVFSATKWIAMLRLQRAWLVQIRGKRQRSLTSATRSIKLLAILRRNVTRAIR